MKALMLFPSLYTLNQTFSAGFKKLGYEVELFDYRTRIKGIHQKINDQAFRLPFSFKNKWYNKYMENVNQIQKDEYDRQNPDIVLVYNSELLLPETVKYFKKKSKVLFFLGDNPFYTPTNKYFLDLLFHADLVISPDSFWTEQLVLMGIQNCVTKYFNPDFEDYSNVVPDPGIERHDLLFIGMSYVNSWGYKRALYLSKFADFDLRIHGNDMWYRWFDFFPELKSKFILKGRYSQDYMTQLHKSAKLYPFDSNPGLLNGVHIRLFDCIQLGILPIPEYRKDIDKLFKYQNLPIVYNYNDAKDIAAYYIKNDAEREELLVSLQKFIKTNFETEVILGNILTNLKQGSAK